jgi:hypothetical protein
VLIRAILRALFGNVLGEVRKREVTFSAGQTGPLSFELVHTKLAHAVVGPHTTKWRWQYKLKNKDPWVDLQQTEHRIFVILDLPTAPWQQTPYQQNNTQLPWTDVLKYACQWGLGATTQVAAATGVTRGVYQLGPAVVSYDCPGGGSSHYSWGGFDCVPLHQPVSRRLRQHGYYVNCSDCATFVSTFANILGCDLWQSARGNNGFAKFRTQPMLGIGQHLGALLPRRARLGRRYLLLSRSGLDCGLHGDDRVYDGCLQVDGDAAHRGAAHRAAPHGHGVRKHR